MKSIHHFIRRPSEPLAALDSSHGGSGPARPDRYRSERAAELFTPLHEEELHRQGYTVIEHCLSAHELAALQCVRIARDSPCRC